jgi:hypothetical protein
MSQNERKKSIILCLVAVLYIIQWFNFVLEMVQYMPEGCISGYFLRNSFFYVRKLLHFVQSTKYTYWNILIGFSSGYNLFDAA